MIVDDEPSITEVLGRLLNAEGYHSIASTTDPFAALPLFREFQPDLVILDLLMPGMSGLEVLAQLRATIPAHTYLPILFVTGARTIEARHDALNGGATDFVAKPCDPVEILARIGNLLETRNLHLQLVATNQRLLAEVAERTEAEEAAERANAAKSEFLSRMSHELRTPLNAILGFGQILEVEGRDPEEADSIEQILKAGRRLLGLVDELLAISHAEDPRALETLFPPAAAQGLPAGLIHTVPPAARHSTG